MKKRTALLVDEAHNLVDRAREMFSAELTKAPFLACSGSSREAGEGSDGQGDQRIFRRAAQKKQRGAVFDPAAAAGRAGALAESIRSAAEQALAAGTAGEAADPARAYFAAQNLRRQAVR